MEVDPVNLHKSEAEEAEEVSQSLSEERETEQQPEETPQQREPEEGTEENEQVNPPVEEEKEEDEPAKSTLDVVQELFADTQNPASDDQSKEVDDYDPESAFSGNESDSKPEVQQQQQQQHEDPKGNNDESADEDTYEPEVDVPTNFPKPPAIAGLPPKPPVNATVKPSTATIMEDSNAQERLKEAYDVYINSSLGRDRSFLSLDADDQVAQIKELFNSEGIDLETGTNRINFDQVYSYNKPFKNLKDPIPLVPIGEFCRRPNITAAMTSEEEQEYSDFIERENYYLNLQNWDEFPDKSRLFIGNLPANTISKQDLFRIFSQYGEVIQIAIKAGYGFTQFRTAESCLDCIQGETNVPLHNKILRLDASRPQKSRRPGHPEINNPNLSGDRGRERKDEEFEPKRKKQKTNIDCQVYITGKSSVFFIRKVKKAFATSQITIDIEDVTQKNITEVLSEAAYSGVLAACVIKELKVDVQTFETTPDGGIRFDEYADVEPEEGAAIVAKAKFKKYGHNMPPYYPQDTSYHDNSKPSRGNSGNNHRGGRGRGGRGRGGHRGDGSHRGNNKRNYGGGGGRGGYDSWNQGPSGPQQYQQHQQSYGGPDPYQQQGYGQPYYGQPPPPQQNPYGSPPQQNTFPSWNSPSPPQQQSPNTNDMYQVLRGLPPDQIQSMINQLQQQQQRQPPPQSGGYGQPSYNNNNNNNGYNNYPPPPGSNNPATNQVQTLLSRLQGQQQQQNPYGQPPPPPNQQQNQQNQQGSSFYDTLSRLARK
ncbi:NAB3 Nuclear polyadenylated RNA-binding protein 3 [Candida maltosa Xu316]